MSLVETALLIGFAVVFALALGLLVIVGQGALRLYRHHAPPAAQHGLLGAVALLWVLSITYNLRVLARISGREVRLAALPLIGEHVRHLHQAEQEDQTLQRTFERFARWYPPYLVLFTTLFGAILVGGGLG